MPTNNFDEQLQSGLKALWKLWALTQKLDELDGCVLVIEDLSISPQWGVVDLVRSLPAEAMKRIKPRGPGAPRKDHLRDLVWNLGNAYMRQTGLRPTAWTKPNKDDKQGRQVMEWRGPFLDYVESACGSMKDSRSAIGRMTQKLFPVQDLNNPANKLNLVEATHTS